MTDYQQSLLFGVSITPAARPINHAVDLAVIADRAGLDLVTFQDHPYQPAFLDAWTLLAHVSSRTTRVRLSGNVLNLPLRQPAVLARAAASLDLLSGGRFELGIGAGSFWDAIAAMGGQRLAPGQAVEALEEAITIIRELWAADKQGGVFIDGKYHRVWGAKRGPAPAHNIGIWVGALKPRLLRMVGRIADGWLPSLGYLEGPAALAEMNRHIDEGAAAAGREPSAVRRLLNVSGTFAPSRGGLLTGPPKQWAAELAELTHQYGISGFVLWSDDARMIETFAAEVVPATREIVAAARAAR